MSALDPASARWTVADDLELALAAADRADAFTLPRFAKQDFTLGWKDDRTEVTEADRDADAMLGEFVLTARPDDGFFGEEHGLRGNADADRRWLVDPIDGTSGFVRGIPVWATLIAITDSEGVRVGVASAPALGKRWWAGRGLGTFVDGRRCATSKVATIADAQVSVTLNAGWFEAGLEDRLLSIAAEARRPRGFGDFWQHCLVAEGALDVAIDAIGVRPYDLAAVRLIVEEAGGRFTDRHGEATHHHDSAVSSNGALHDRIIARLT